MRFAKGLWLILASLALSKTDSGYDYDRDYDYFHRGFACIPPFELIRCIDPALLNLVPGLKETQNTFCGLCRSVLERYATECFHEAAATIYNRTIALLCEKQSDFICTPNTQQQACMLRYVLTPSLFGEDDAFCSDCKEHVVDYARTCVGETVADGLSNTLNAACDAISTKSSDTSGTSVAVVAYISFIQALLLALTFS